MNSLLKNIFRILNHRERKQLVTLMILDVLISILDILFLAGLLYVINFYAGGRTSSSVYYSAYFSAHPLMLISIFFLLFAIKNLFGFIVFKGQHSFVYGVASRISKDNLLAFLNGSYNSYVHTDSSINIRKISQQPIEFCLYVLYGMQQILSQSILILITIAAILVYNSFLFPLLLLILVPPIILIAVYMKRKLTSARLYGKTTAERSIQYLQEALSGYIESNVFGRHEFFSNRYNRFQSKFNHYLAEKQFIQNMPSRLIEVFAVFGLFMLVVLNLYTGNETTIQLVTLGAFMAAAYKVIPGIVKIMNTWGQVKTYLFTMTGLVAAKNNITRYNIEAIRSVEFNNVSFTYPGKKIIESFCLNAVTGDIVGIAGVSGKGKTTIANLLLGFLNPDTGNILINGNIANEEKRQGYWSRTSYIKQQPFFLYDSILTNITLEESVLDQKRLTKAVALSGLDQVIQTTDGLSMIVTENGKNFSGGQRQRIIFSRTLYKEADLLILDEPFNELDEVSESAMMNVLKKIAAEGKIILLITHNKKALSFCNKQILLDEG
ncbi:MAG: ABC transporter ATP-binding protein [Ferruginibacter sp.]